MKFSTTFQRFYSPVPAGKKGLGSDVLPVTGAVPRRANQSLDDNCIFSRFVSINGWPISRIAVACKFTGVGAPVALGAKMYFFEENLMLWVPTAAAATSILPGTPSAPGPVAFFDVITLTDLPQVTSDPSAAVESGSINQLLIVDNAGGAATAGRYDFVIGADLTGNPL